MMVPVGIWLRWDSEAGVGRGELVEELELGVEGEEVAGGEGTDIRDDGIVVG